MSDFMGEKEIRDKMIRYQLLENQVKALSERREFLLSRVMEMDMTIDSLEEVVKNRGNEISLPLGSGIHVSGTLSKTNKIIAEVGANIAVECTSEKAKKILDKRKDLINDALKNLENNIVNLSNELAKLEPEIRNMIAQSRSSPKSEAG